MRDCMPWFKLYGSEYLSDAKVQRLSLAGQGMLLRLWCYCSMDGTIPADTEELSDLLNLRTKKELAELPRVLRLFQAKGDDDTVLISQRLLEESENYNKKRSKLRANASKGGKQKVENAKNTKKHEITEKTYPKCTKKSSMRILRNNKKIKNIFAKSEIYNDNLISTVPIDTPCEKQDLAIAVANPYQKPTEKEKESTTTYLPTVGSSSFKAAPRLLDTSKNDIHFKKQADRQADRQADPQKPDCLTEKPFEDKEYIVNLDIESLKRSGEPLDNRVLVAASDLGVDPIGIDRLKLMSIWSSKGLWALLESVRLFGKKLNNAPGYFMLMALGKTDSQPYLERVVPALALAGWESIQGDENPGILRGYQLSEANRLGLNLLPGVTPAKNVKTLIPFSKAKEM